MSDHWKRSISAILATGLIILTTTVPLAQVARAGVATPALVPCTAGTNCGGSGSMVAGPYLLTETGTVLITLPPIEGDKGISYNVSCDDDQANCSLA